MRLTERRLNRATLARQLLLQRRRVDVVDAVRRITAIQAQEPASPYIALWNRIARFDPTDLDRAFAAQRIVKATLLRITLHAVAADDYPAIHEAMQVTLRSSRLNDRRFRSDNVPIADVEALVPELLEYAASPRGNRDVEAWLEERFGAPKPRVWWALRQYGPIVHAPSGGPWTFGPRPAYVGAAAQERPGDPAASVRFLVRRYLEGFGPATMADIAQFGTILRPPIKAALEELGDELVLYEGPGKATLYDVPGGPLPDEDTPAPPRLMAMWDSTLMAYADRGRMMPAEYRKVVMRNNGDVLPTILVDGHVAGVWRPVEDGIEVSAFHRLAEDDWHGLETEARRLRAFLADREPMPYRRYVHWWSDLPAADVRVLR